MALQRDPGAARFHLGPASVPGTNHFVANLETANMGYQAIMEAPSYFGQADYRTGTDRLAMETLVS
jgi:hypothetical protein